MRISDWSSDVCSSDLLLPDYPPAQFRWRRVLHQVVRAEGPERLLGEWWRSDLEEADAPPRDYFRVEDQDGRRYWLYRAAGDWYRSEEHTSELQSLMRISYAVFCLKKPNIAENTRPLIITTDK